MSSDNYPYWPIYAGGPCCSPLGFEPPATSNCPPSPTPPWHRETQSPLVQTLTQAGNIDLTVDTTYLDMALQAIPSPVAVTIPDGNFKRQTKTVLIRGDKLATTATFSLAGTFAGFTSLTLDASGSMAVLLWDGEAWQMVGGNAAKVDPTTTEPDTSYVVV